MTIRASRSLGSVQGYCVTIFASSFCEMKDYPNHLVLRDLSLASRLVVAAFLLSVGIGYISALVQLHVQHATPGKLVPGTEEAASIYYGRTGMSQLERLLVVDEAKPFNGSGTMRQAFTRKSAGWTGAINRRAKEKHLSSRQAEEEVRTEREGERLAVLEWIHAGASRAAFEQDNFVLPASLAKHSITHEFVERGADHTKRVKIAAIVETRCARCHSESRSGSAAQFPLDTWEQVHDYCEVSTTGSGMSLKKLSLSSHVHLLGLGMLYGLTGLIVTLTSYPAWARGLLGLLPLTAQVVDIAFWWLGRIDPMYAKGVVFAGSAAALGLFLQIALTLFDLFGRTGRIILVVLILVGCLGGYVAKEGVIDPYLVREAMSATVGE
jgi:hypothetical protein